MQVLTGGQSLDLIYYITTPFRARKRDSIEKKRKKERGSMISQLTIYLFDDFLHKLVYQHGTLCILSGQPLFATFRNNENASNQLSADVNKGVLPQVQFKPQ